MGAPTRYIVIAAGDATRWGDFMGVTKHFAVLNGEPVILRTIRLLIDNGVDTKDIHVVSKDYQIDKVNNYRPKLKISNFDADKFLSSAPLWNKRGRTVILYGDVYFSEYAMNLIVNNTDTEWRLFCRPTASSITGTPYGECFAVSLHPQDHQYARARLNQLVHLYKGGLLNRVGGWEWARLIADIKPSKLKKHRSDLPVYITIDDETDDIDYPDDYIRLKEVVG